jgi:uncharacterized protein
MTRACPVIVMAKAPRAGFAKTRLIPTLGPERAAALAERLLDHAVEHALAARIGPVDLCCAPDRYHPAFDRLAGTDGLTLSMQGDGDLGQRMERAFDRWLATDGLALMIGTDAPALTAAVLRKAAHALESQTAVFVPAHDGGYALIGLRQPAPTLFEDMPWSTPQVMALTRDRLAAAGLRHTELAPVHDIDTGEDLIHLPHGWLL